MSEYLADADVWITQTKMPLSVKGFCKRKVDANCVVVNQDLSEEEKRRAVEHEILHFRRGDLDSEKTVEELER